MRLLNVSLAAIALGAGCLCTPAFAQQQDPWGVSERAVEKRELTGVGFLEPERYVMCRAMVGPVDGTFAPVLTEQGESLGFVIENESEVPVSVVLETRDEHGDLQGSLFTRLGASTVRRLGLSVWPEAASSATLSTVVRVMPLRSVGEISVVVGQQKVSGTRPDLSEQMLTCSAEACALRVQEPEVQEPTPVQDGPREPDAAQPEEPQESTVEPGAEPSGVPGIGPHGPHNSNEPDAEQPGGEEPGAEQPGGEEPGAEQPGGEGPGGEEPGAEQPEGEVSSARQPRVGNAPMTSG